MGRPTQEMLTGEKCASVKKYSLTYIRPYHREIARLLALGATPGEVSTKLDITPGRLSIIMQSEVFENELARLEKQREAGVIDVTQTLADLAPVMIEQVERLAIFSTNETMRLKAAQDLLDRNKETSKVTKHEGVLTVETHEQRIARLTGVAEKDIHLPKNGNDPKIINVTPTTVQPVSTSGDVDDLAPGGYE